MDQKETRELVVAAMDGDAESELCIRYDITMEDFNKIMREHKLQRCPKCGIWHNEPTTICRDC